MSPNAAPRADVVSPTETRASLRERTLLGCLRAQAERRGASIALRRKVRGIWEQTSWKELEGDVARAATALSARGFEPGDHLVIATALGSEALVLALAAQWLGGTPVFVELSSKTPSLEPARACAETLASARFVFVEDAALLAELEQARDNGVPFAGVVYVRGSIVAERPPPHTTHAALSLEQYPEPAPLSAAHEPTWVVVENDGGDALELRQRAYSDAELLRQARTAIEAERLSEDRDAFAFPGLSNGALVPTLLPAWLLGGFRLNLPERGASADQDRRELGPELLLATSQGYATLHQRITENLPREGTWSRSLLNWALATRTQTLGRLVGEWLVRRPLRDVIGFSNVTSALVVGHAPPEGARDFLAKLGVTLRTWPNGSTGAAFDATSERAESGDFAELQQRLEQEPNIAGSAL